MFVCIKLKQFYLLINWFWVCFFHSDYVKVIYITGLLIWIMHSPKSIESTMYTSAVHSFNNRQIKNGIYLSLIIAVKWENTCTLLYQYFTENFFINISLRIFYIQLWYSVWKVDPLKFSTCYFSFDPFRLQDLTYLTFLAHRENEGRGLFQSLNLE